MGNSFSYGRHLVGRGEGRGRTGLRSLLNHYTVGCLLGQKPVNSVAAPSALVEALKNYLTSLRWRRCVLFCRNRPLKALIRGTSISQNFFFIRKVATVLLHVISKNKMGRRRELKLIPNDWLRRPLVVEGPLPCTIFHHVAIPNVFISVLVGIIGCSEGKW